MTRSIGRWTAREVAEAHLFERDLLGLPPRRRVRRSWNDSLRSRPPAEDETHPESLASTASPVEALEQAPPLEIEPAIAPDPPEQVPAATPAPTPPFPTNCTTLSVFRRVPLEVETDRLVTPAGATTPPVLAITTTAVPRIANFAARLRSQSQTVGPTERLVENSGRALIDTGHFRVDPGDATRFQVRVKGQLCHPARAVDRTKLPDGENRFPVVVIIHGQHASIEFNLTDTGGPRTDGCDELRTGHLHSGARDRTVRSPQFPGLYRSAGASRAAGHRLGQHRHQCRERARLPDGVPR